MSFWTLLLRLNSRNCLRQIAVVCVVFYFVESWLTLLCLYSWFSYIFPIDIDLFTITQCLPVTGHCGLTCIKEVEE